ncbi:ABC transporter ATP-binding protein [Tsukamurella paurometabola]|uniref:ABC transporter ATP-binding protein n=1 Tax=Tsukamurella paurometabola TaxID=2061 RepID=A0ABS5NBZ2_TSUPA|nr:ABC transporter ATP-binding protein [Tsukamurella paurometabola]MBS4101152.1 ABC transporter ATP-binding protein [Tsukamurella paurometabola]
MSSLPLDCTALSKSYGRVVALDGVDLHVHPGEIHGFLGPNGAGKSTTIRAVLGQIRPDAGTVRIFGTDGWSDAVVAHRRLAYVPGDVALWPGLTGGQCIDLLGALQGSPDPRRRDDLIERFELDPTRRTRTYSKGNRQKVALVAALSTRADLLLLDEPTSGLDPLMEAQFQSVVRELAAEGTSVLLSSHIMGEVEALCDRVSIIRSGRIVRVGTLDSLRADAAATLSCTTAAPIAALRTTPGVTVMDERSTGDRIHTVARAQYEAVPAALAALLAADASAITVQPPSLDEMFLDHYRGEQPERTAVPS